MDLQLDGKVAVVTGTSKGIGRAVAEQLGREGADVVITGRTAEPLEAAAKQIAAETGRVIVPMASDVSVPEVAALVALLASPGASFISGAHIRIDGAERKAIMDQ